MDRSYFIRFDPISMLPTIYLDNHFWFVTEKVYDIWFNDMLPSELETRNLAIS